jgi:hypothetical protein
VNGPRLVAPYAGQDQQSYIPITAPSRYQQQMEEGPWSMPPYAQLYPPPTQGPGISFLPPPIRTSDLWSAMGQWPL